MLNRDDLIWTAGLVDGEGCISIMNQLTRFTLRLEVAMTHEPSICRLETLFGLSRTLGYEQRENKNIFMWVVLGGDAATVIDQLCPYLYTKHPEAKLALQFYEDYMTSNKSKMPSDIERWLGYYQQLAQLKTYDFPVSPNGIRINAHQVMEDYKSVLTTFQGIGYTTEKVTKRQPLTQRAIQYPLFDEGDMAYANESAISLGEHRPILQTV